MLSRYCALIGGKRGILCLSVCSYDIIVGFHAQKGAIIGAQALKTQEEARKNHQDPPLCRSVVWLILLIIFNVTLLLYFFLSMKEHCFISEGGKLASQ